MQLRFARRGAVAALAAIGALLVGSAPASAAPEKPPPHAYGAYGQVVLLAPITVGPISETTFPGNPSQSVVSIPDQGLIGAGVVSSSVNSDDQGNTAKASIADLKLLSKLPLAAKAPVTAGVIETSCTATTDGIKTTGKIAGLTLLGAPINIGEGEFKVLDLKIGTIVVGKLTLNEVVTEPDGSKAINGLHLELNKGLPAPLNLVSGELVLAHSHCAPAAPNIPLASGAGLWIGLGLLGVVGIPVGIVVVRRRKSAAIAG